MFSETKAATLSRQNILVLCVLALTVLGAALRFYDLGSKGYWQDEVTMVQIASDPALVHSEISEGRPPVYVLLAALWVNVLGTTEAATRSLSAVASILSIPLIYIVGRELFNAPVGMLAAFMMAISGRHILHAQDFRYYSVLVLLVLLAAWFYLRLLRTKSQGDLLLYVIFSALIYYTHLYGLFVLAAFGLHFVLNWFQYPALRLKWFLSQVAIIVLIGYALVMDLLRLFGGSATPDGSIGLDWLGPPPLYAPLRDTVRFLFYGFEPLTLVAGAAVIIAGVVWMWRMHGMQAWRAGLATRSSTTMQFLRKRASAVSFVLLWFVLPIMLPFVISFILAPVYFDRYVLTASPAFFLLLAIVIYGVRRLVSPAIVAAALAVMVLPAVGTNYFASATKEEWREAAAYIQTQLQPGDVVAVMTLERDKFSGMHAFEWYYEAEQPVCQLMYPVINRTDVRSEYADCSANMSRLWVVKTYPEQSNIDPDFIIAMYADNDLGVITLERDSHFHDIAVWLFSPVDGM